ncbi:MAG: hypothetical protein ACI8UO_000508 [Verrucomicrobiales bacterium]|jgi:hypothetical protein
MILPAIARAESTEVKLWAVDSMTRVGRTAPAAADSETVRIEAARNETEPFQVIVTSEVEILRQATVEFSPLRGPGGFEIDGAKIFYEHYVRVVESSPKSPYKPGLHPDPLIPVTPGQSVFKPITELPASGRINQPFWVDIRVPAAAPPGSYSGEFTLTTGNGEEFSLPVELIVWDFTLPSKPSLQSEFGLEIPRLERIHGVERGTSAGNRLLRAYEDLLADHLLVPESFNGTAAVWDGDSEQVSFLQSREPHVGTARDVYRHFFDEKSLNTVGIPLWPDWPYADALGKDRRKAKQYVAKYVKELAKNGWDGRVIAQCGYVDEPRSRKDYALVRDWGQFYNEIEAEYGIEVPMYVTEQPAPEDESWGSLAGYVDIWVVQIGDLWDDMHGYKTGKVAERRADGDEIWLYCSLTPMCYTWEEANGSPEVYKEGNPPAWLIDFPPMNHRITAWIAPIYEASGFLYWSTIDSRDGIDPWKRTDTFAIEDYRFNGDGLFIYPGYRDTVGYDGPVASMRLKWIRESFEDHAYISMLEDRGEREFALNQIRRIARNVGDWADNPTELFAARRAMAKRLAETDT